MALTSAKQSGFSVILLPTGDRGREMLEVAKSWVRMGLLGYALWINDDSEKDLTVNPPKVNCFVIASTSIGSLEEREEDLFTFLARFPANPLRLIVVCPVIGSQGMDQKQIEVSTSLASYLDLSQAQVINAISQANTSLSFIKTALVAGATELADESFRELSKLKFTDIYVASPEARSIPMSGDAFVREQDMNVQALVHAAAIGGLWTGLTDGLAEIDKEEGWFEDQAKIGRVYVSAVLSDGFARRASTHVLNRAINTESSFVDFGMEMPIEGTYPIPEDQTAVYIKSAVDKTFEFDGGTLKYAPMPKPEEVSPFKRGVLGFILEFFRFAGARLLRVPYYAAIYLYRKFVHTLNMMFQGGRDGYFLIEEPEEGLDKTDKALVQQRDRVYEEKNRADLALASPFIPSGVRSTPVLWGSLRKLAFGLLDGSNLGEFGYQRSDNGWPIFYRVKSMFHDPADVFTYKLPGEDEEKQVSWSDLTQAEQALEVIYKEIAATKAEQLKKSTEVDALAKRSKFIDSEIKRLTALLASSEVTNTDDEQAND